MQNFTNVQCIKNWHVVLPNNLKLKALLKGDIFINYNLKLTNVLYVPDSSYNLLSLTNLSASLNRELIFFIQLLFDSRCYNQEEDWFS